MIRILLKFIFTIFLFLLQCCVFPNISMGGIVPNLMIIMTVTSGFMHGEKEGMLTGFGCGLLIDIFFGTFLGLNAAILVYIGFLCGKLCGLYYPEDIRLPMVLIFTGDFTYGIAYYLFSFLLRGRTAFGFYLKSVIIPEALYTVIVSLVLYPIIVKSVLFLEKHRSNRRS